MPNGEADKDLVKADYLNGMKYKDLATKYDVTMNTVKSWITRYKWTELRGAYIAEKRCTKRKKEGAHKTQGATEKKEIIVSDETPPWENLDTNYKHKLFVAEYLKDFNATRAAMAVGYSKKTAYQIGWELLKKPTIQVQIKQQSEMLFESIGLTSQRILMEYMKIAGSNINDYLDFGQKEAPVMKDGKLLCDEHGNTIMKTINYVDFKESSEVDTSLIQEVKLGRDGASIKLYDKMKAMEMLAKYMQLINSDVNINVQQNINNVKVKVDITKLSDAELQTFEDLVKKIETEPTE